MQYTLLLSLPSDICTNATSKKYQPNTYIWDITQTKLLMFVVNKAMLVILLYF